MRIFRTLLLLPLLLLSSQKNAGVAGSAAASAAGGALSALKSLDYRYFVAGGTCAAISHGITTPIDVVKTRIQSEPQKYSKGMLVATADILKEDGPGALLGGLGPTVVGYGTEGAMKFGVYEVMKPVFAKLMRSLSSSGDGSVAVAYLLASVVAGAIAAVLLCPMESTRIKIVTDPAYADKGLLAAFPKMLKDEGLFSSFAGLWAMLSKQVPYTLGKQVSFDVFAGMLYAFFNSVQESMALAEGQIKWAVSILAAFLASLVACIFSQPGDMILTETYRPKKVDKLNPTTKVRSFVDTVRKVLTEGGMENVENLFKGTEAQIVDNPTTKDRSFVDIVRALYAAGGVSNFFTGTGARIVHVGLIITSQLVIYDQVKQILGLPATGSH